MCYLNMRTFLFIVYSCTVLSVSSLGLGNSRRTAARLKKRLEREDAKVMGAGKVVLQERQTKGILPPDQAKSESILVQITGVNLAEVYVGDREAIIVDTRALDQRADLEVWLAARKALDVTASEFSAMLGTSVRDYFRS